MDCRRVRELLPLYAEGDLDGAREARVAEHMAGCPACRERSRLDRELAEKLAAFMPAESLAARRAALRAEVMAQVEKERRWQPWRRAALQLGNAATWLMVSAVTVALVLATAVTWQPLAERAWGRGPAAQATPAPAGTPAQVGLGWEVVQDEVIASPYYWVIEGERVDRTPQLSPDGTKVAHLPTADGQATDLDRLVVRDLATGQELDLTPEQGYSYTSVRWSPDGRSLAFVKYRYVEGQATPSELWRVDAGGGNLTRLYATQPDDGPGTRGASIYVQRWSADGQHILLDSTIWGGGDVARRVRAADGRPEPLALPTAAELGVREDTQLGAAVISPSDDYVLCIAKTGGLLSPPANAPEEGQSLVLYDLAARQARVLASFPHEISAISESDISPDGEWIVVRPMAEAPQGAAGIWVVRRDGTGLREVTLNGKPAPGHMPGPLWADGGHAYFNQPPEVSAIWMCELDAASGEAGIFGKSWPATALVSVSRDSRKLLTIRSERDGASLHLLTLAPGPAAAPTAPATVVPTPGPSGAAPAFGAARDLIPLPPSAGVYRVSPDGRWVVYPVPGGQTADGDTIQPHLEAYATAGGQVATVALFAADVPGGIADAQVTWYPDSKRVLVVTPGEQGQMLAWELGAQTVQVIARAPQGPLGFGEVAISEDGLSPDGWQYVYTVLYANGKAGIEFMRADGSGGTQIVAPEYSISHLAYATLPGGENVFFFQGQAGAQGGKTYEMGVGVGAAPAVPQPRVEGMCLAACSPGNTRALWLSEPADAQGRADLYLSAWPVEREPTPVAKGVDKRGVAWAGSDEWFVYSQAGALYLAENGGREQLVRLTPEDEQAGAPVWAPGMGLIYRVARDGRASLRLLPLKEGTPEPSEQDTAGLTVEEHDVTTVGTGFANNEGTEWIGPEILDVRRAWREPAPAEQVVATNEALRPFGLRLEPKEKPGWSQPFYDLYKGDRLVLGDLDTVWPASVSAAGDDFALLVEQLNGGYYLVRATGSEKWDGSQQQGQPPVFVGRDLVSVTGTPESSSVTVVQGELPVYTLVVDWPPTTSPVRGLWSWQGHWVLEASGHLIQDGVDLNDQLGYDEIFGYRLIKGQPFYFFKKDGRVGVSYDGVTLPQQYDEVRHYGCCSAAAYNPGGNDTMTWFFGLRDGTWYYVEMGRYGAEEVPPPTAEASEPAESPVATPQAQGAGAFKALHMVDAETGWALAERGILRTSDGGATWEEALPWWREGGGGEAGSSPFIAGSFFLDAEHAWVAWGSGAGASTDARLTVEYTADGGRDWQSSLLPLEGMGAQFSFVDARRGWLLLHQGGAAGSEGVAVLGTLDGGDTWRVLSASDPQSPQPGQVPFVGSKDGISFRDAASGWLPLFEPVSGKFFLYVTHDGGHAWAEQALALPAGYEEAQATPEAPVFFSAQEGVLAVGVWRHEPSWLFYVTHDGGATWAPTAPVDAAVGGSVVSEFVSVDEGWALVAPAPGTTDQVELRHTADGGRTWAAVTSDPALGGMLALDFVDSRTGWALCTGEESTYLLKTTDGGSTWARMP